MTFYIENAIIRLDMWEMQLSAPRNRGFSVRSILAYVCAAFIAALLLIVAAPQATFAADASWKGDSITYNNQSFNGPASSSTVSSLNLSEKTTVYTFVEPSAATDRKIHILFFSPGVDPGQAESAQYQTYSYSDPDVFTNPSEPNTVTLDPSTANNSVSSCDVDGGLGWIICPFANTLAGWMDTIYDILSEFLTVRPAGTDDSSPLHRAWTYMLTIANIAFVIAFLIIIYSQLTSYGISNYGIKKLLPRIVVAALLVNLSYLICSLAIDISNVLGYGIQDLFIQIRNSLITDNSGSGNILTWQSITSFILSGGALAGTGVFLASSTVATYGIAASLALLLPALMTMFVAVLVALVVMAARQAIITVLVILAPLAFVAYLLPNTEKWFDRWRGSFMTMLILFPAFSVIFGGSQLAGTVIIQNANSINLIILGMIVQVAPLFITPFLIKFSGSLLGRIAGMVNNPNKGMIDRTRNYAKDRAEDMRAKRMATPAGINLSKRLGQRMDRTRRKREGYRSAYNGMADANWANRPEYSDIAHINHLAADKKQLGEGIAGLHYAESKLGTRNPEARDTSRRLALNAMRNEAAKRALNEEFTNELSANKYMVDGQRIQTYAGGVQGKIGASRALAKAYSDQDSAHAEAVKNAATILSHGNYTDDIIRKIALGDSAGTGINITSDIQEAAIAKTAGGGNTSEILEIINNMPVDNSDMRQVFAEALMGNKSKPKWITGGVLSDFKQGKVVTDASGQPLTGKARQTQWALNALNKNKLSSADVLVTQDSAYLEVIKEVFEKNSGAIEKAAIASFSEQLNRAMTDSSYAGRIGDNKQVLEDISKIIGKLDK